jgi:hypothetical protein
MLSGYAGDGSGSTIAKASDGYKNIELVREDFKVVDRYCKTAYSDGSAGTTTIFFKNAPVWWMSYAGYYPEKVIPFLKTALAKEYEDNRFAGGRGPRLCVAGGFIYQNFYSGSFTHFKGREEIHEHENGGLIGFHEYFGMALL